MFALRSRTEIAIHALLIAVILFNAFIPTTAIAMPIPRENEADSASNLTVDTAGMKDSDLKDSPIFFRAAPVATPTKTVTEAPTPKPSDTATPVSVVPSVTPTAVENTPTSVPTLNSSPTLAGTPTASGTPVPTQTSTLATLATALPTLSTDLPTLSLEFLATPNQAKAGDRVTFTLKMTNKGTLPVTGLLFSDVLPEGFNSVQSDDKSFVFDSATHTLTWKQDALNPAQQ